MTSHFCWYGMKTYYTLHYWDVWINSKTFCDVIFGLLRLYFPFVFYFVFSSLYSVLASFLKFIIIWKEQTCDTLFLTMIFHFLFIDEDDYTARATAMKNNETKERKKSWKFDFFFHSCSSSLSFASWSCWDLIPFDASLSDTFRLILSPIYLSFQRTYLLRATYFDLPLIFFASVLPSFGSLFYLWIFDKNLSPSLSHTHPL